MTPIEVPARSDSFRPVLGATVLLVLALLAIAGLKSSRDLETARARERLRVRIDRLRHDPGMLERLAREDLGMVRPGDVIIELPVPGAAPSPNSPRSPSSPRLPALPTPPAPPAPAPPLPVSAVQAVPVSLPVAAPPGPG